jgi:2-haloacid dehalogenase
LARICVFDVNETLLDLGSLDPLFEEAFGDARARREWFSQLLQSAFVATITGAYSNFGQIGAAALQMTAERRDVSLTDDARQGILGGMRELPPHPEVPEALDLLRDAGIRLTALTNSTLEVAEAQLGNAGLADRFEAIFSADAVERLKPAPEPYRATADALGVETSGLRLVAAHAWDVAGAMRAGCAAAFVARPGMVLDPLVWPPDVVGLDLSQVASAIIASET